MWTPQILFSKENTVLMPSFCVTAGKFGPSIFLKVLSPRHSRTQGTTLTAVEFLPPTTFLYTIILPYPQISYLPYTHTPVVSTLLWKRLWGWSKTLMASPGVRSPLYNHSAHGSLFLQCYDKMEDHITWASNPHALLEGLKKVEVLSLDTVPTIQGALKWSAI